MTFEERVSAFYELGQFFNFIVNGSSPEEKFRTKFIYWKEEADNYLTEANLENPWFTKENIYFSLNQWAESLQKDKLRDWMKPYTYAQKPLKVGIVMAGNIPLVGFHDLLSVIISGHKALIKPSSKDEKLMRFVINYLQTIDERFGEMIQITERLRDIEAVIATGSNNTARYFEQYFKKIPHIIRKNRTAVAILNGNETVEELKKLGEDVFRYFGLGCRNVTHIYLPENYNTDLIFEAFYGWKEVINHTKYANNYDYNRTIYLMSEDEFLDNNFLLLRKDEALFSPISVVNYSFYKKLSDLEEILEINEEHIQCIVASKALGIKLNTIELGETQHPKLDNYADEVDTLSFLSKLGWF